MYLAFKTLLTNNPTLYDLATKKEDMYLAHAKNKALLFSAEITFSLIIIVFPYL